MRCRPLLSSSARCRWWTTDLGKRSNDEMRAQRREQKLGVVDLGAASVFSIYRARHV